MIEPLKIVEPFNPIVKRFENPGAFNLYYKKHKAEVDAMTTIQLNKAFKIPGYHFGKLTNVAGNKEIVIRREHYKCKTKLTKPEQYQSIQEEINEIKAIVNKLIARMNVDIAFKY
jgi:hypothetical protein